MTLPAPVLEDEIEEHFVHVSFEVAPAAAEYVPISQSVQVPAPGSTLNLPAGHASHAFAPCPVDVQAVVPGGHWPDDSFAKHVHEVPLDLVLQDGRWKRHLSLQQRVHGA